MSQNSNLGDFVVSVAELWLLVPDGIAEALVAEPEFDRHSGGYSDKIGEMIAPFGQSHDFFVRSKADILRPIFATIKADTSKLKVLDVGCGVGLVHPYILDSVGELHATDVSRASLHVAGRTNPHVRYLAYDGSTLPYEADSFDCAYAICVMHHVPVPQWQNFLREMRRVVRPNGVIVIIEHNPLNPATQWIVRTNAMDENAVLLTPWKLRKLMKSVGVSSLWLRYVLFVPFAGKVARAIDGLLARVPLGTQYVLSGRV